MRIPVDIAVRSADGGSRLWRAALRTSVDGVADGGQRDTRPDVRQLRAASRRQNVIIAMD